MAKRKNRKNRQNRANQWPERMLYIAYGSNLDTWQMAKRCPGAYPVGAGVLKNYRLTFRGNARGWGVADVLPCPGAQVPVGVWSITRTDLKALDQYEGFPTLYDRHYVVVEMEDGQRVAGLIYRMTDRWQPAMPSQSYVNTIACGYVDFDLPVDALKDAIRGVGAVVV